MVEGMRRVWRRPGGGFPRKCGAHQRARQWLHRRAFPCSCGHGPPQASRILLWEEGAALFLAARRFPGFPHP